MAQRVRKYGLGAGPWYGFGTEEAYHAAYPYTVTASRPGHPPRVHRFRTVGERDEFHMGMSGAWKSDVVVTIGGDR